MTGAVLSAAVVTVVWVAVWVMRIRAGLLAEAPTRAQAVALIAVVVSVPVAALVLIGSIIAS